MRLVTARLLLTPVCAADLPELITLKADPRAFAVMLGGVRSRAEAQAELAADLALWGSRGVGMWTVRDRLSDAFVGISGIMERPDGRGLSLRFAIRPELRGQGFAREAAAASLRDGLDRAAIPRIIAIARADNYGSRTVLGGIGMREVEQFVRGGCLMVVYLALGKSR